MASGIRLLVLEAGNYRYAALHPRHVPDLRYPLA
jgi:hypothetical protein